MGGSGYDILILDGGTKQSLSSARSLGRAGVRVALAECTGDCGPTGTALGFRSKYALRNVVLPDIADSPSDFGAAVAGFVAENPVRVVLPTGDGTIGALRPWREKLAAMGCVLALAPDSSLEIANDKDRTLELASRLGIEAPTTLPVVDPDDLPAVIAELGLPFVIKPTASWTDQATERLYPVDVINEAEARSATQKILDAGAGVLAQQFAPGAREGVTLFVDNGEIKASCGHVAFRTSPPLGGASAVRQSIPVPPDLYDASVRLVQAMGVEGPCEVEYRRDAKGRPLLMEVNARLAGTLENAIHSGVDIPLMTWQWAAGLPVSRVDGYKTGITTRWLKGDIRWLLASRGRAGRPDSVSMASAAWTFSKTCLTTIHYDEWDVRDPAPVLTELRAMAAAVKRRTLG
jgi:predicted ATP-grasp superfamily ATP-dependent carboligase